MPSKHVSFNFMISPDDYARLKELALHHSRSAAAIIREGIKLRFLMEFEGLPMCANGTRCLAPNMHGQMVRAAPRSPEPPR